MRRLAALFTSLALAGCIAGIPDADGWHPPLVDHSCDKVIIVQPNNVAHCMTNEEFARWVKRSVLPN